MLEKEKENGKERKGKEGVLVLFPSLRTSRLFRSVRGKHVAEGFLLFVVDDLEPLVDLVE